MKSKSTLIMQKAFFLSALLFLTLLFSCKKDGKLTPDFDNGNLAISYLDTFAITTSVEREDSLRTDALALNMIGIYNDPIFGYVSSSLYTQVLLTGVDLNFGDIICESNIEMLRPAIGITSEFYDDILGFRVARPIKAGSALEWTDLTNE